MRSDTINVFNHEIDPSIFANLLNKKHIWNTLMKYYLILLNVLGFVDNIDSNTNENINLIWKASYSNNENIRFHAVFGAGLFMLNYKILRLLFISLYQFSFKQQMLKLWYLMLRLVWISNYEWMKYGNVDWI